VLSSTRGNNVLRVLSSARGNHFCGVLPSTRGNQVLRVLSSTKGDQCCWCSHNPEVLKCLGCSHQTRSTKYCWCSHHPEVPKCLGAPIKQGLPAYVPWGARITRQAQLNFVRCSHHSGKLFVNGYRVLSSSTRGNQSCAGARYAPINQQGAINAMRGWGCINQGQI
jgi:hypothetical protein